MTQVSLSEKLTELRFNRHQLAAALGNIVGRMAILPVNAQRTSGYNSTVP